jgi:hypothetical protein
VRREVTFEPPASDASCEDAADDCDAPCYGQISECSTLAGSMSEYLKSSLLRVRGHRWSHIT